MSPSISLFGKNKQGFLLTLFFIASLAVFLYPHSQGVDAAELTKKEKKKLVRQAVKKFKSGQASDAKEMFLEARVAWPENSAVNYYLGIIYLNEGDKRKALNEWRIYIDKEPDKPNSLSLRKHMTILRKNIAKEAAKEALLDEVALYANSSEPGSLAIFHFENLGSAKVAPLGKGLTAFLITDIAQVPDLKIVERIRMQAILDEMRLNDAGFVAADSALKMGKLLRAEKVVLGNYTDEEAQGLKIYSSLAGAAEGRLLGEAAAEGSIREFFSLEKELAFGILKGLGYAEDQVPASVKKFHTKNFEAFQAFSVGLDYFDREEYKKARDQFQKAMEHDPDFELARSMLLLTPLSAIGVSGIIANATASGPSSVTAVWGTGVGVKTGVAVAATVGAGSGIALATGAIGGGGNTDEKTDQQQGTAVCTTQSVNGTDPGATGSTPHTRTFDLLKTSGTFPFTWETGQVEDHIVISYQNTTLFDSSCVSGNGTENISYSGESTEITVTATPNCLSSDQVGSFWQYTVGCP